MQLNLGYRFGSFVGASVDDGYALAHRGEENYGFRHGESESWVLRCGPAGLERLWTTGASIVGMWLSPSGRLFIAEVDGTVRVSAPGPRGGAAGWVAHPQPMALAGVWGLSDDLAFAWGRVGARPTLRRWDGRVWHDMPAPGQILDMGGASPDGVYAVGVDGLIARWDSGRWTTLDAPTRAPLGRVVVVSEGEMYVYARDPWVLEGSRYGWSLLQLGADAVHALAKFDGRVWVATGGGLGVLERNAIAPVNPRLDVATLALGPDRLFVTCPEFIVETSDGKALRGFGLKAFADLSRPFRPLWNKDPATTWDDDSSYTFIRFDALKRASRP